MLSTPYYKIKSPMHHRDLLDHTLMHCPRFFTAAIGCSGAISSPLWQITRQSLLGILGLGQLLT